MNAIMTDFDRHRTEAPLPGDWQGLAEIDHAIRENRITEYRIRKSWADPWARKLTVVGVLLIMAVFSFLIGASFGLW